MKKIITLVSLLVILTGCSIDWNNEKDKKIKELEVQINKNDIFIKNTKCAEIGNQFFLDLKKDNEKTKALLYTGKIKYSEKLNTCVAYYSIINSVNEWYKIIDINTKEELGVFIDYYNFHDKSLGKISSLGGITYNEYYKKEFGKFNNKIKEYFGVDVTFDGKSYDAYNPF